MALKVKKEGPEPVEVVALAGRQLLQAGHGDPLPLHRRHVLHQASDRQVARRRRQAGLLLGEAEGGVADAVSLLADEGEEAEPQAEVCLRLLASVALCAMAGQARAGRPGSRGRRRPSG